MKTQYRAFSLTDSKARLDEILNESDTSYEELNEIPGIEKLTFKNGFYFYCSSVFVDVRGSKKLADKYKRPTLAKIYRSFISEMIAVFASSTNCRENNIHGDCVWAVFNTPLKADIDLVFATAAKIKSIIKLINKRMIKIGIEPIDIGIGISYGRALMIKAGFYGSGINDIVYMGDVVNDASDMCSQADTGGYMKSIIVTDIFYNNLSAHNKSLLCRTLHSDDNSKVIYGSDAVISEDDKWINENG